MKRTAAFLSLLGVVLAACTPRTDVASSPSLYNFPLGRLASAVETVQSADFGAGVSYEQTPVSFSPDIAKDFSVDEIDNIRAMEQAFGVTFTDAERRSLAENKFVMKKLLETNIQPTVPEGGQLDLYREFLSLYAGVRGSKDYKARGPHNAVFLTSDLFLHSYNLLYVELLKEMENEVFYPSMKELSRKFYEQADTKMKEASETEKKKWMKVRNYFAVPYALLFTAQDPLSRESYMDERGMMRDPAQVQQEFSEEDRQIDTYERTAVFVRDLGMDNESAQVVLADLQNVFTARGRSTPEILRAEYEQHEEQTGVRFLTDWTQFTPRSHYTSSSLRREYFRAMSWYIQLPFFVKSPELTEYAFAISQLLAENPDQLSDYAQLESAINFLVGTSDDLMPADYLQALESARNANEPEVVIMEHLTNARPPRIKSIPAAYPTVGEVDSDDVLLATKGMRFFSGKFIIDSYWTGQLTQGDEMPKPGYTQKLPPMASSLEVMGLLGSAYARSRIPELDFYKSETREAIDQAMRELTEETAELEESYWKENIYTGWLWTIRSLFSWQEEHHDQLPRFMQSRPWEAKTLQTASGFWTELRHATLLYAKQSFAELGGGPPPCDTRQVPPPPKGYIEPQPETYDRLVYLARRTEAGLTERGFDDLQNLSNLRAYIEVINKVRTYSAKELHNEQLQERVKDITGPDPYDEGKTCTEHVIDGESDWEEMRLGILDGLANTLPMPVEGPVVSAKDKRAAVVADVHTGGDLLNPHRVLYEGVGVPHVIFTAVKDRNGPRLTVGFTYAHYEFTEEYGGPRLTDEQWQDRFYEPTEDPYEAFDYKPLASWPVTNFWYDLLFPR